MQTIYYHFRKHTTLQNGKNSARKQVPQSARLSEGGGVRSLFGQCPNRPDLFQTGASLMATCSFWQPVVTIGSNLAALATFVNLWELLATYGSLWRLLATSGNLWQLMVSYGNIWQLLQLMVTLSNFWEIKATNSKLWQPFGNFFCWKVWKILATLSTFSGSLWHSLAFSGIQ